MAGIGAGGNEPERFDESKAQLLLVAAAAVSLLEWIQAPF